MNRKLGDLSKELENLVNNDDNSDANEIFNVSSEMDILIVEYLSKNLERKKENYEKNIECWTWSDENYME